MKPFPRIRFAFTLCAALAASLVAPASSLLQNSPSVIVINATKPPASPEPLPFPAGGRSPDGRMLSTNNRYLMRDGVPWLPVMGEFHFARYPEANWEEEILKMKAAGIQIISTYIFWIHHEEIEGQFDWSGRRDLRRFVDLCSKHGMYVWVRVGPWAHGECRNGGFPDWLVRSCPTRQNDPAYLSYVRRYFGQIGQQLKGMFWKDGGPIIGLQIENEYSAQGAGKGVDHILALERLAREANLDAPFYTVTGWDGAQIPSRDFLPIFGGYADGFWFRSLAELPPYPNYFFTNIRCEENVGDDLRSKHPEIDAQDSAYPYITTEMGGGMELSYHRRPSISPDDTAAMELVKLGSGVTMYGFYMFHGGTNPDGKLTTLQESQATGYPNDMPVKNYDFQAPLGEFGQIHPVFRAVKIFDLFLHDFGSSLAPMAPYFPEQTPESRMDTSTPRVAARIEGDHGFIFLNNYQRTYPLPERKNLQIQLKMAGRTMEVPRHPVNIPSGAYTIWPVNLPVGDAVLVYSTAQLLCKLDDPNTYVFFAWPGISPEFDFVASDGASVEAIHARVAKDGGHVYVDSIEPRTGAAIRIQGANGKITQIVVLSRDQALNTWKATVAGRDRLFLSPGDLFFEQGSIHIRASDPAGLTLGVFPKLERTFPGFTSAGMDGIFDSYASRIQPVSLAATVDKVKDAGPAAPVKMGKEVALAPTDAEFGNAARWTIRMPHFASSAGIAKAFLRIDFEGDVARLYAGDRLITDTFYNGAPWEIGLQALTPRELDHALDLKILPLRQDAPIYLPAGVRAALPPSGDILKLKDVRIVPEYEAVMDLEP
jgi:beta-galactosidase